MDTEGPKPTNGDILNKLKEESCEQGVISFILAHYSLDESEKPNVASFRSSFNRLKQKHKQLIKDRIKEVKKGISGQTGTYDHWASQIYSLPSAPAAASSSNVTI